MFGNLVGQREEHHENPVCLQSGEDPFKPTRVPRQ